MQHWSPGMMKWATPFEAAPLNAYTPPNGIENTLYTEYHSPAFPALNDTTAMLLSQWQTGTNKFARRVAEPVAERLVEKMAWMTTAMQESSPASWTGCTGNVGGDEWRINVSPRMGASGIEKSDVCDMVDRWSEKNSGKASISLELELPQVHFSRSLDALTLKETVSCQQKRFDDGIFEHVQEDACESPGVQKNAPKVLDGIDGRNKEVGFSSESFIDRVFCIFSTSTLNSARWLEDVRPIFSSSQVHKLVAPDGNVSLERVCDALSRLVKEGKCEVIWVDEEGDERMQYRAA